MSDPRLICVFQGCGRAAFVDYCKTHKKQLRTRGWASEIRPACGRPACSFEGCESDSVGQGLCGGHYAQQRHGRPLVPLRQRQSTGACAHQGCDRPAGMGNYCKGHERQLRSSCATTDFKVRNAGLVCSFASCERSASSLGLCTAHYAQQRSGAELAPIMSRTTCRLPGCDRTSLRHDVCTKHRRRAGVYGLTEEELIEMMADASCRICGTRNSGSSEFAIDHDHACCPAGGSCGSCVRGVLCASCNLGLGAFGDNVDMLRSAIAYLEGGR